MPMAQTKLFNVFNCFLFLFFTIHSFWTKRIMAIEKKVVSIYSSFLLLSLSLSPVCISYSKYSNQNSPFHTHAHSLTHTRQGDRLIIPAGIPILRSHNVGFVVVVVAFSYVHSFSIPCVRHSIIYGHSLTFWAQYLFQSFICLHACLLVR